MNARVDPAPDFASHLRVLLRRKRTVALVLVAVVAVTLVVSFLKDPVYRATVKVLLERGRSETVLELPSANANPERRVETEMDIIRSEPVRTAVEERLGPVPKVSVSQVGASDIVSVAVRSKAKAQAAQIASAYANAYIDFRRGQAVEDLDVAVKKLQARVDDLERQIDALTPDVGGQTRDQLRVQQTSYRQRLHDLQIDAELTSGGARVVTQGEVPVEQVEPAPLKSGLMAVAAGLILGIGAVFLTEYLDDTVRTKEDLERVAGGLTTLALIPAVKPPGRRDGDEFVMSLSDPVSPAAEAFRVLRTSFEFLDVQRAPSVIQVTSAVAGEGKTSVASNLAVAFARGGQRVIVVDCDLRRPRVHRFFGCSNEVGTVSVLLGRTSLEDALQPVPNVPGLQILPGDSAPPNVLELLGSRKTAQLLAQVLSMADVVLVDCPPVLPVTDAAAMSAWVDATLVVASAGMTSGRELRRTVERLAQIRAPLVGAVLNRVSDESEYGYLYYDYHERPKRQRRSRTALPRRESAGQDNGFRGETDDVERQANGSNGSGARPADRGAPQADRP